MSAGTEDGEDDIAAQVGIGSAAADSELDALKDAAEAQLSAVDNLLGSFASIVASFCHQRYFFVVLDCCEPEARQSPLFDVLLS